MTVLLFLLLLQLKGIKGHILRICLQKVNFNFLKSMFELSIQTFKQGPSLNISRKPSKNKFFVPFERVLLPVKSKQQFSVAIENLLKSSMTTEF